MPSIAGHFKMRCIQTLAKRKPDELGTRIKFTQPSIEAIKPSGNRFVVWSGEHKGLGVRVSPNGARSFIYAYRFGGKACMMTIGNTNAVSLKQAIVKYAAAFKNVADAQQLRSEGKRAPESLNPSASKRQNCEQRSAALTVDQLWDRYEADKAKTWRPKTAYLYAGIFKSHVSPNFGAMKITDINRADVRRHLKQLAKSGEEGRRDAHGRRLGGGVIANRTRTLLAALFNY